MKRYIPLFESKLVDGEFGKFGFLSKEKANDLQERGIDGDEIMMEINMKLLDMADKGDALSKLLNKLDDMRVDSRDYRGKLSISFPMAVGKNPKLQAMYTKLVKDALEKK